MCLRYSGNGVLYYFLSIAGMAYGPPGKAIGSIDLMQQNGIQLTFGAIGVQAGSPRYKY